MMSSTFTHAMAPWLFGMAAGAAVSIISWLLLNAMREVPGAERQQRNVELPLWWRLLWPLTITLAWHAGHLLSLQQKRRLDSRLQQAGLRHFIQPKHLSGARQAAGFALAGMTLGWWSLLAGTPTRNTALIIVATAGIAGMVLPSLWLNDRIAMRRIHVLRALPFVLDMTTLCVEGGLNLHGALEQAADKCPPSPLRDELRHALGEIRTGATRAAALRQLAARVNEPAVRHWITALIQADALGMNLGPLLRAQSDQRRSERFLRAEKRALEAPVKMLFPMVAFIFPCTFIVIAFPIAVKLLEFMQ